MRNRMPDKQHGRTKVISDFFLSAEVFWEYREPLESLSFRDEEFLASHFVEKYLSTRFPAEMSSLGIDVSIHYKTQSALNFFR